MNDLKTILEWLETANTKELAALLVRVELKLLIPRNDTK